MHKTATTYAAILSLLAATAVTAEPGWRTALADAGVELHGFADYAFGMRTGDDPYGDDVTLNELRFQVDAAWYHDLFTARTRADFVYDDKAAGRDDINLETGRGFLDLREVNLLFTPLPWMDVKLGRQTLTWGTGDLVFINDLFPKDWQAFFLGRDTAYLKAPSDALFVSVFPGAVSIDLAYTPRFDADRFITGERLSYWNGLQQTGGRPPVDPLRPDDWFADDEVALRAYGTVGAYELALYGYHGFWKSPGGIDPLSGAWRFPALNVVGASLRGALAGGIGHLETGYYDSADDRDGTDPFVNNSELRFLAGYEREAVRNVTLGVQYYLERVMNHDAFLAAMERVGIPTDTAREEDRHTLTLRLTWLLMNQNLVLGCFARYSPSEEDLYLRPSATYKLSDRWRASLGANVFAGDKPYTFLGQFEDNTNIHASLRCSY